MRKIHIIGGGTVAHIRPHLALAAPAYGATVRDLFNAITFAVDADEYLVQLYTTKMAGNRHQIWTRRVGMDDGEPPNLETNADIAKLLEQIVADPDPSIVFLPAALCDFDVEHLYEFHEGIDAVAHKGLPGKDRPRLSSQNKHTISLTPAAKVIQLVRKVRKDIFLVGFKTTTGAEKQAQFNAGLALMKQSSCNLVLANDLVTRLNMVITPEQAPYFVSTNRWHVLRQLVGMALVRARGRFTRSRVVDPGCTPVGWNGDGVPASLREVVNHCIKRGAYKPFMGKTVGHFAFKQSEDTFITSRRGVDFNQLDKYGMVLVKADGDDKVTAYGYRPSVGGQSQRIIFRDHPDVDCIVHFHCPLRPGTDHTFPVRPQGPYECGSHECGDNTSGGLESVIVDGQGRRAKAVMLDKHGPNIVFDRNMDPKLIIDFIERHWDLDHATSEVP